MAWLFLVAIGLAAPRPAEAEDRAGARFSWVRSTGAETCPDADAIGVEVAQRLGRDPFEEPISQTIEGVVQRRERGGFVANLFNRDVGGELIGQRQLESETHDCAALASAVALAVALAIDPDAALAAPDALASENTETLPEAGLPPHVAAAAALPAAASLDRPARLARSVDPSPSPSPPAEPSALQARLGVAFASELVPGVAPGVVLSVEGPIAGPLRFSLGTIYFPEQLTDGPDAEFGFGLTAARAGVCVLSTGRLVFGGCGGLSLGAIHAVVYQPHPTAPGDRFYGAIDLTAVGMLDVLGPLFVAADIGLAIPLLRYQFRVEGRESVEFRQTIVVPTASLTLGVRFS
jgi:hypothetical protein